MWENLRALVIMLRWSIATPYPVERAPAEWTPPPPPSDGTPHQGSRRVVRRCP